MKETIKKMLSPMLAIVLLFTGVPFAGFVGLELPHIGFCVTAKATTQGDFKYSVRNNKAEITDYTGSATQLSIPSELGGYPVTSIGDGAFFDCDSLTSITIPDSVTSIGDEAFRYCDSLTSITIPDSVTSIGDSAFSHCDSLTSITIPDSVTSIGYYAFRCCYLLTSITVDVNNAFYSSDEYGVLFTRDKTTLIQYPIGNTRTSYTIPDSVTSIGDSAFCDCDSLTSITIPDSVTSIGDCAFYDCDSLTSITIPDSVTSIGDSAFCDCDSLASITIPDSVTSIGDSAFCDCDSLASITIPDSVTSIGAFAFYDCDSLTSITIPDSVTSIGYYAFRCCYLLTSITVDVNNAFYSSDEYGVLFTRDKTTLIQYPIGNTRTSYTIPDSVTSIGDCAFRNCDSLTSITIPDSVTSIGDSAFCDCDSLASITIPDSVTSIGDFAFSNCDSLTSITIPDSVTSIGDEAFYGCSSLTVVYFLGSKTQWNLIDFNYRNECLTNATIYYLGESESGDENAAGYKLRLRSDGAYSDSIAVGEEITFWTFLYNNGERENCNRAYAISFDTPGIFEVVKTNITSVSFDVTLKACKAGTTNMTVSDSETGTYVTIRLKANNPIEVITMDEVKNLAKEYQKGRLTHFYNYNGLYVDGYSYRKNNDGSYNVSMNVYNEKAHHGAVVSYDKDGNIVDYELIDPQDKLPTSLWDGLFDSFDLVNAQLEKLKDKYLYDSTALTKMTRIDDLNVPDGGYFVISNNYLENEYVFFSNSINVAIDLICAYSKVNKVDVPDKLPEKATEKVLEKIFKDLGPDQIKTVFKELVKNFAEDLTISNVDVFMSGMVSTFNEFEINIEEIIKDTLEDLMTDTEAHLDFAEDIVLTLFGADAIKTALSSLGYINTAIKLIDVFSSSLAPEIVVYTPAEKDTVRTSNGVTVTSETPLASDYVLHTYVINESDDVMTEARPTIETLTSNYTMYDITLYKSSQATQPNAKITVMLPIPVGYNKNNIQIYWYKDDGTLQSMNAVVKGDYAVFETDHLSYYVLVEEQNHSHNYVATSTIDADCKNDGLITYTCVCENTYTETIPALGHDFSAEFTVDKEATYTQTGVKSKHCLRNGCAERSEITEIPKLVATFTDCEFAKVNGESAIVLAGFLPDQILVQAGSGAMIKDSHGNQLAADKTLATGMTLVLPDGKEYPIAILGDADGDGVVSVADARLALRASVGLESYAEDSVQYTAANVGLDDPLSVADARLILRASVGLDDPRNWMQ